MPYINIRPSYIVFLLYLLMSTQPINGLEEPLTLCETQSPVTVRDLSGGTIQHVQRTAGEHPDKCQLVLTGFNSSAYVSLPGVETKSQFDLCTNDSPQIIINRRSYCVQDSVEGVIIALINGALTLKTNRITKNFTLEYYSNVAICGGDDSSTMIPSNATHDQLSCIIANIGTQTCSTTIRNLQSRSVKLELLYNGNGEAATFNGFEITKADPIILRNPGDELVITHTPVGSTYFKLTVLTCEDVPHVQNSTSDASLGPWFSSSQANYTCSEEGYEFKNTSSVTCQLNSTNQRLEWSDSSDIMCIPVPTCGDVPQVQNTSSVPSLGPWFSGSHVNYTCSEEGYEFRDVSSVTCQLDSTNRGLEWSDSFNIMCIPAPRCLKPLKMLSNTNVNRSRDNLTVTYQCIPGYQVPSEPGEVTVTCSSPDPDTVPWTWNDTNVRLNCTRVECRVADIKMIISNGMMIQEDTYYYMDTLSYTCDEGYVKRGSVLCQVDGSWSAGTYCEIGKQTEGNESTQPPLNIILIAGSTGGSAALIVLIIVMVVVVCRRRRQAPSQLMTEINKDAVADTTGQSVENPYFHQEYPDVTKVHTARSTTKQYEDVAAGPYDVVELEPANTTNKPTTAKKHRVKGNKPGAKKGKLTANITASPSENTDVYAEVHPMKLTHYRPPPSLFESPDPVYGDAPAVPVKLERFSATSAQSNAEEVIMVDNGLYEAAGGSYGSA